ncbi:hypothetical protein J437_LFUL016258 [Ladona fulva]|uniref:Uncharacterized protein n=1 Tax=Ladona fulva TaxID=123851 RepID=A0A8K0PAA4_LADFU|nr:hypothetical protein J437_LFUL016258 [Ladona fulva]
MYSVMLYLGILEKRVIELISVLYYVEKKRSPKIELGEDEETIIEIKDFEKQDPPSALVAEVPCSLCLEQQNDAIEDNDEDSEPMSHAETKLLLLKTIDYPETQEKLHDKTSCKAPFEHRMFQR